MSAAQTVPTSPASGYANPLRAIVGLRPERVDQGVDYGGAGPIYALGDGVIENVFSSGWPGGVFIDELLTDGPAQGLSVYYAEDIHPTVNVGDTVTPQTVIGNVFDGPEGIETGWADPNAGSQRALGFAQWGEKAGSENSTAYGINYNALLESLGAPGGNINGTASGSVPSNFPTWNGAGAGAAATVTNFLSDPFSSIVSWLQTWALKLLVVLAGGALIILGATRAVRGAS